jgi:mxaJ protein
MFSRCHNAAVVCTAALLSAAPLASSARLRALPQLVLRVCADPNNMPFSNKREEGFENRIAHLIAKELGASVQYTWWAERRGFIRNTLKAGECDLILGVPSGLEMAALTKPYYRSSYVFVSRTDRRLGLSSIDDPSLRTLRIGVHIIGDDYASTPPAEALGRRQIVRNIVGFSIYGDYSQESPPSKIMNAVERGDIDVAIVWGPLAGYYAKRSTVPLQVTPVLPQIDPPSLPFVYEIAVGVRRGESAYRDKIQSVLERRKPEIDRVLDEYGVPRV